MNRRDKPKAVLMLLTRIREEQRLPQADVAQHTGLSQAAMSHLETGNRRLDLPTFLVLLDFYGVTPVQFFERLEASTNETES